MYLAMSSNGSISDDRFGALCALLYVAGFVTRGNVQLEQMVNTSGKFNAENVLKPNLGTH